jgi:uncharacterized membrane protein
VEASQKTALEKTMRFSTSVRKSRPIGLGFGLAIAFAILVGLVNAAPMAAQLQVCNHTKEDITAAFSIAGNGQVGNTMGAGADQIATKGFYKVAPGACSLLNAGSLMFDITYLFAWEDKNPKVGWTGIWQRCVPDDSKINFTYQNQKGKPPCGKGQLQVGFFQVDDGSQPFFTATLNEPTPAR